MGLSHNAIDNGFRNRADDGAASGTASLPFPRNVLWRFAVSDQYRLRHWPDLLVRPASVDVGDSRAPTGLLMLDGLTLEARPAHPSGARGMPVRIGMVLPDPSKT